MQHSKIHRGSFKHQVLLAGLVLTLGGSPAAIADLVALYDFEGDTQDASGNGNHATAQGSSSFSNSVATEIADRSSQSFDLTGSNYVELPFAATDFWGTAQNTGATLSVWMQTASDQREKYLFSAGNSSTTTPIYGVQGGAAGDTDHFRVFYRPDAGGNNSSVGPAEVFGNGWRHVVMTDRGGTTQVWVDGALDITLNQPAGNSTHDLNSLGALVRSGGANFHLTGQIDEAAFYDRVLTSDEIAQLAAGLDPTAIADEAPPTLPLDFRINYDGTDLIFRWNSEASNVYNLKTSMNLSAGLSTWHLMEGGIGATEPLNTLSVPKPDDRYRFYVLEKNLSTTFGLWSGDPIPSNHTTIPFPDGLEHHTLLDGSEHTHHFLHGAAIINFNGVFYANWANSPVDENSADETLQGRSFTDAGDTDTWSDVAVIGSDLPGADRRSHAAYLEHQGQLWTFAARFGTGEPGERFDGLRAEAFVLNETNGQWESQGIVMTNCWPYEQPVRMSNGNYIVGGQDKDGLPVVAISDGDDLTQWDSVLIPYPSALQPRYAETSVWAEGSGVTAVIRGGGGVAWVATSIDGGRTWAEARPSNLPMPRAKAYLGKLSTGQLYLISNLSNRNTMVISVGRPGGTTLSATWRVRYGSSSPVPEISGSAKSPQWSYPYGYEHDGKLYIVYSIGKEDCGLSIIPVSSLANP